MISKKSKYALKALDRLVRERDRGPVLIAELAERENIPKKFLEAILLALKNHGILQSRIGKGGGYSLALPPEEITIGRVIAALEGDLAPVSCLSSVNYRPCEECADEGSCGIRLVMADVWAAITGVLGTVTLAEMVERSETARRKQAKIYDYVI